MISSQAVMIASFFVPQQVLMLPRYVIFSKYGMLGTAWTLVVPSVLGQGLKQTLLILVYWQFLRTIPASLEEAAMIDGASLPGIFFRIGVPLAAPGIVTTLIFIFINAWNEYTVALCLISTDVFKPMTVGINIFNGYNIIEWQYLFASSLFAIIPVVILFMSIEKNLTSGLTAGGVKG